MTDLDCEKEFESFGQFLRFLLFEHGARPDGSPDKVGEPWVQATFAARVGKSDRLVRYWLDNEKCPRDLRAIERVIFGASKNYDRWRLLLRKLHQSPIRENEEELPSATSEVETAAPAPPAAQILHPEIRHVPGFTGRTDLLDSLDQALWQHGGTAALTNVSGSLPLPGGEGRGEGVQTNGDSQSPHPALTRHPLPMGEGTSSPPPRSSNSDAASAAIHGLGGVGKSVLAQEYGWRNRERYRGVWWLRAEQPETLLDDLIALGSRLMPGLEEIPEKDRAVHLALDAITQTATDKPWLFIYDNAESPAALDKLTPAGGAHLIVTSRWSDWYGHAEALPVDVFPPEVAADYLMERTRHPDRAAAKRLAEALGYLPLALSHARATCWASNLDFDSYRERMSEQLRKAPRGADYPQSVYATFDLAIRKAASLCPQAELLMAIAAFFAPDRIPVSLFTEDTMSESERDDALATLAELSLITHETLEDGAPAFTMHRLVQAVMRDRLGDHTGEATLQALKLVLATLPKGNAAGEHTEWSRIERVLPHALSILRYAPDDGEHIDDTISLCVSAAAYFRSRAAYKESQLLIERELAISAKALGPNHLNVGQSLNNLAVIYREQGKYDQAEPLYKRAFAILEEALGPDHPETGMSAGNLAGLLETQGRYDDAEQFRLRALEIHENTLGPDHPNVGIHLNNLALLYDAQGRYEEAEPLFERALTITEKALGPDHPNVGNRLNNLAGLYCTQGRYEAAEPFYMRSIAIREKALGPDHPDVGKSMNGLALLYDAQGRYEEAEPLFERALTITEKALGPDHPDVGNRLNNLAGLYQAQGRHEAAEPLLERALAIDEKALGPDHPSTGIDLNNLAALYRKQGRHEAAAPLCQRALAIFEKSLGPDHPNTQRVKANYEVLKSEMATQAGEA